MKQKKSSEKLTSAINKQENGEQRTSNIRINKKSIENIKVLNETNCKKELQLDLSKI